MRCQRHGVEERGGLTKGIWVETGDYVLGIEREYTRRPHLRLCHPYIPESIRSEVPGERKRREYKSQMGRKPEFLEAYVMEFGPEIIHSGQE